MATELVAVLDVDTAAEAQRAVAACGRCSWFKVGAQLFTREGPPAVHTLHAQGKQVFLDLKYHDIPNTVRGAVRAAAALDVGLLTIHASGGCEMVRAARTATEGTNTRILAVTILTSLDDAALRDELGLLEPARAAVPRLAELAVDSGAHGIVCSPQEIKLVRAAVGPEPLIVTPGIRPAWAARQDQQRVMTPAEAAEAGADLIVVGRPILQAPDPAEAVERILEELQP